MTHYLPRNSFFCHLKEAHNFYIGDPDNFFMIDKLLDALEEKIKELQCFFCERKYKSYQIYRDHMRKKRHFRLNPKNELWNKFFSSKYIPDEQDDDEEKEGEQEKENNE